MRHFSTPANDEMRREAMRRKGDEDAASADDLDGDDGQDGHARRSTRVDGNGTGNVGGMTALYEYDND